MSNTRAYILAALIALSFLARGNGVAGDHPGDVPVISPRPIQVAHIKNPILSLNGRWYFKASAPPGFETLTPGERGQWAEIQVPSEWAMQGFSVTPGAFAAYARELEVPADWIGNSIKLRFDGVQSECTVWVNGIEAGKHEGGFTVFEFDVTRAVHAGANTIAVAVRNESLADTLASATQYAAHSIGGITRKATLFALPPVHIADQFITTKFRPGGADADLEVNVSVVNESGRDIPGAGILLELIDSAGKSVSLGSAGAALDTLHAGERVARTMVSMVRHPFAWDPEHPYLYTLRTTIRQGMETPVTIAQRIGFREVEVRGNRLFVNNVPVKLRGVNRHETHPLLGRSTSADQWRNDVELFRAANVNFIRTSHYPPTEEFLDACDELGVFVECESALCWVQHGANPAWEHWDAKDEKYYSFLLRANLENVVANRAHPAIIIWSLANESEWSPLFAKVLERVKRLDPSRPTSFHDQCWGEYNNAGSVADVAVYHYPDEEGPAKCDSNSRPVLFGEYAHLQTYNRREVLTDPGVRDDWGRGFERMADLMWKHDGCLGGAIWAGIDDIFYLPDGKATGYGPWGIIDGWRRPKPEYWHVRKSYSPVKVVDRKVPLRWEHGAVKIPVTNRFDFTNLKEVGVSWSTGSEKGKIVADIAPHQNGEFIILLKNPPLRGQKLEVRVTDPRGFECEHEILALASQLRTTVAATRTRRQKSHSESAGQTLTLISGKLRCEVDRSTGKIRQLSLANHTILSGGPSLMILPLSSDECKPDYRTDFSTLNTLCTEPWVGDVNSIVSDDGIIALQIPIRYREAEGAFTILSDDGRSVTIDYTFTLREDLNPRQWGVVVSSPVRFNRLNWTREGQWTTYPDDHIGRLTGEAVARPAPRPSATELRHVPAQPWFLDAMEMGSNDFRSTKKDVTNASLHSPDGEVIATACDSPRSIRAFADGDGTGMLIAGYSTGGGEGFFAPHYTRERVPLKKGDTIHDRIVLRFDVAASSVVSFVRAENPDERRPLPPGYPDRSASLDALPGFVSPPRGYGDVAFYWWMGDTLTRERLTWQMDQLKDHGVTGLQVNYAHSDSGGLIWGLTYASKPRLFSEEWWNLFRWFLSEAKKRGMSVSLSDYTLGHAGQGWFVDSMLARVPSLAGSRLVADTLLCKAGKPVTMPVGPGLLVARAYKVVEKIGQARLSVELRSRIKDGTLRWTPPSGSWTIIFVRRENVPTSVDPMHPLSGKELIATFFQPFEDHCPGEAGKGLNFFFSDELDFGIRGYLWDAGFASEFQRRKKYPVLPQLPALFIDIGPGTPKIRMDYSDVMVALSEEHFFKPVYDWHTSRGMVFGCDHGGRGKDVTEFGDYFRTQRWMSGPGCDQPRLERDIVKAKVASSIAHLYDRPRTWLEGFHSSAWGTSSAQVADAIFANYALGHNLLSLHGLYYSTHGGWWEWAPPDNHWRQPYWKQMTGLMSCTQRLSYLLSQGRHVCDVAIVYPVAPVEAGIGGESAVTCAFSTAETIYKGGWDFDFIDFSSLASSRVQERTLAVSGERYKVLILPALGAVRYSTMEKALEFYRGGGTVMAIGRLSMASDRMGRNDPKLDAINQEIFGGRRANAKGGVGIIVPDPAAALQFLNSTVTPGIRVGAGSAPVYTLHRRVGPRDVYFVYGAAAGSTCVIRATGKAELWNPRDGSVSALPVDLQSETETRLRLPLGEKEPQLIVMSPGTPMTERPAPAVSVDTLLLDGRWGFELKPTLYNRWGDFRLPAYNGTVGAEAWQLRRSPGADPDTAWMSPQFNDSDWPLTSVSFGPRMYRLGPMPVTVDSAAVESMLSRLDTVDQTVPVQVGGKAYRWMPVEFSWRWGIHGDPGHQGYHGLKGLVHDDVLELGTPHRDWPGVPDARLIPDSAGQRYYFWSTVHAPSDSRATIEQGGLKPSALWVNHHRNASPAGRVDIGSGWTPVLLRYDSVGRGFVVFRDAGRDRGQAGAIPLAASWYGDPSILQYDLSPRAAGRTERFRCATPPGLKALTFAARTQPKVWIDGIAVPAVRQTADALRFPDRSVAVWRCELQEPRIEPAAVALEFVHEPGIEGGAVLPEPLRFDCASGTMTLADLSTVEPLRTYSGGMIYRRTFRLPAAPRASGNVMLDLGSLVSSADVRVNGQSAGIHSSPPWTFDVTRLVREGDNTVEVEVYNTLANYYLTTPTPFVGPTTSGLVGPVRILYSR